LWIVLVVAVALLAPLPAAAQVARRPIEDLKPTVILISIQEKIYSTLKSTAPKQVKIYRKLELPAYFHYGKSGRIGDIVAVVDEGWLMTSRDRYRAPEPAAGGAIRYRGEHGYDNQLESMRALFVAHGPAFKKEKVVEPFENVDVYNVMAKILGLKPAINDGGDATAKAVLR